MTDRILLDRLATQAWPGLEQVELDGWLLRASYGVTKRANSALPVDADVHRIDGVLPRLHDFYVERELPVLVQVSDPAFAAALDARGWATQDETVILTGPVARGGVGVTVADVPTDAWLDCWWAVDGRGGARELQVARDILARVQAPVGYASAHLDGRPVAVARGVVQQGWLGVFGMAVLPIARRRGLATAVLRGLANWASGHGARSTFLQVMASNAPALSLYDGLGFGEAYRYAYRSPR